MPLILIIGAVVIALGTGFYFWSSTPGQVETTETTTVRMEETAPVVTDTVTPAETLDTEMSQPSTADTTTLANGTFNASATYLTPKRDEHTVAISLTIVDGIVAASSVTFDGLNEGETSNPNQERFLAAYEAEVIGKPVAEINLSRVGGASLTTGAFNDAVAQIRTETGA